ncbi:autotransporter outer membrane beta-barrel domain-containing protein [Reyranella sp.]|uniref:autotransporter outer membrane beta-barrel domain-containing protein n=1 Tax=Reyranella sp. TaxID=1929291 RepID=UPI003BA93867
MNLRTIYRSLIGLAFVVFACGTAFGQYMPTGSTNIPLSYVALSDNEFRLAINVGINGGPLQSYLFDTGSPGFNAAYNPTTWNGFGGGSTTTAPASTVPNGNNVQFCYGTSIDGGCRGYMGNIVQIPALSFEKPGGGLTTLTAPPSGGFQMTAVTADNSVGQRVPWLFPGYFCDTPFSCPANPNPVPPDGPQFYGIFGAGDFTMLQGGCSVAVSLPSSCPQGNRTAPIPVGSVLGQISATGSNIVAQGFVVAANGQRNPAGGSNPPSGAATVVVGGSTVPVTACNPCVTVGLTPQLIGQFAAVGLPSQNPARHGLVHWARSAPFNFVNPYGSTPGNNATWETGVQFAVSLTGPSGTTTATAPTLLDTGTPNLLVTPALAGAVSGATSISMVGVTPGTAAIPGLAASAANLSPTGSYSVSAIPFNANILGLPFFMQNSVMFDLSDRAVGYTPFFVTDAPLATTAGGPLIVSAGNVPLGLAGIISGPGGVTVGNGGAIQTSATNTYTGATTIFGGGMLFVSGPGSIGTSSGVINDGVFDISRAWAPVAIASLTGTNSGQVNLGSNTLIITNGTGVFAGNLVDGGAYPVGGGSVTIAGGSQTLAGTNTYTGGTQVSAGTLNLTGSMVGSLTIAPGASFNTSGGYSVASNAFLDNAGTFTSQSGAGPFLNQGLFLNAGAFQSGLVNTGTAVNNGTITGDVTNSGTMSGNGTIAGNFVNGGMVSPGNSIGSLSVAGSYTQAAGSSYLVETNAQGQSDLIAVSGAPGTATIAAGTSVLVAPASTSPYAPRTTYTILNASGGVTGTYSSVASSLPFLLPSLSYDANNVYLALQIGGFARQAQTPNQAAVGAALDAGAIGATGDFATVLGAFSTMNAQQGVAAMNTISGQNYSAFSSAGIATTQIFMTNFANTVGGTSGGGNRVALAEACDVACDTSEPARWGAWGGALGGFGVVGGNANAGTLTYNLGGFAAGLDRRVTDELLVGVTAGFTSGSQWVGGFSGRGLSDTFQAGLYASYAKTAVYVDALAAYAYSDNQMQRQITIPGLSRTANGRTGANLFFGQLEAGYRFDIGGRADAYITPFARLQGATATQSAFSESGAGALDLSVAAQTTNSLRSVLGAQLGGALDLGWRDKLAMTVKLGWGHEYADTARPVTASFVGAPAFAFTTYGAAPQRDSVVLGLSASTAIADATSLYFRYEGNISSQDSNQALTAGFRMTW